MKIFLICALVIFGSALNAQQTGSVSGQILDEALNNEPLLLATVILKSNGQVCKTNFHGKFEISGIPSGADTLVISHPGYETLRIALSIPDGQQIALTQSMNVMTPDMDEVDWKQLDPAIAAKVATADGVDLNVEDR